jgi:hypothetical protein
MKDSMFKIEKTKSEDGEWELISFEKIDPEDEETVESPVMTFADDIKTSLRLGRYTLGNLSVDLVMMPLYGEKEDSVGLSFKIGNRRIDSHGVLRQADDTGIPTDREGSAIRLSSALPDDFYDWLEKLEKTMTWGTD